MDIHYPRSIEDHILFLLQKGPLPVVLLIEQIRRKRPKTTKQAVYACLRTLRKKEVVVTHRGEVSLSTVWLASMSDYFSLAKRHYSAPSADNSFLGLHEGEKIQYYFKSPVVADAFWSHAFYALVDISSPKHPVCIYNPHEWFLLARTKNETALFEAIRKRGQKLAVVAGGKTYLDKLVRTYFDGEQSLYETLEKPLFPKSVYYVNIIGDFIIEAWIDTKAAAALEAFYARTRTFGDAERKELENIVNEKGRTKLSISRSSVKAERLRKKLGKHFFL